MSTTEKAAILKAIDKLPEPEKNLVLGMAIGLTAKVGDTVAVENKEASAWNDAFTT